MNFLSECCSVPRCFPISTPSNPVRDFLTECSVHTLNRTGVEKDVEDLRRINEVQATIEWEDVDEYEEEAEAEEVDAEEEVDKSRGEDEKSEEEVTKENEQEIKKRKLVQHLPQPSYHKERASTEAFTIKLVRAYDVVPYMKKFLLGPIFIYPHTLQRIIKEGGKNSVRIHPVESREVELELFFYSSPKRAKAFYGELVRKPDVILEYIPEDVPPIRFARIIEELLKGIANLICISYSPSNGGCYNLWFDEGSPKRLIRKKLRNCLMAFPDYYGYAVYLKGELERRFMEDFLQDFSQIGNKKYDLYPRLLVEPRI